MKTSKKAKVLRLKVTVPNLSLSFLVFTHVIRRRKWQPTPVLLPGKSHGWRSIVGYGPRGHKELDTTEQLHFHFHFHVIVTMKRFLYTAS